MQQTKTKKMNDIILFDPKDIRDNLLPMTFTRPVCDIRIGVMTIQEKWKLVYADKRFSYLTINYLQPKFQCKGTDDSLFIAGNICPNPELVEAISKLELGEALSVHSEILAYRGNKEDLEHTFFNNVVEYKGAYLAIRNLYDIFMKNGEALEYDFRLITTGKESQPLSNTNTVIGAAHYPDGEPKIFIEKGAYV